MDLSTDRSRLDCYFRGSRPAKPAGALSAPPDFQLTPDEDADNAEGSEDLDAAGDDTNQPMPSSVTGAGALDVPEETAAPGSTARRQQSGCGSMDEDGSDIDGADADMAAADGDRKVSGAAAPCGAAQAGSRQQHEPQAGHAQASRPARSRRCQAAAPSGDPACAEEAPAANGRPPAAAADVHPASRQQPTAEVKREADAALFADIADVDLREQAALMALFEDRRRSSHTKRLLAAATNSVAAAAVAAPLPQDKVACASCQEQCRHLGRSVSAPASAGEVNPESAAKRQRTLRKYFQVCSRKVGHVAACCSN